MKNILIILVIASLGWLGIKNKETEPAIKFLTSLNEKQLDRISFPFDDIKREMWSFLPGSIMWRPGLKLKDLSEDQRILLFNLLHSSLSESGYKKAQQIIELENVLAEIENNKEFRDDENYFVSFYGSPQKDSLWAWSFEGHHLSLKFNNSATGTSVVPRFMGASPAIIQSGKRKGERTLQKEEDFGIQLIQSMNESQQEKAIFKHQSYFDIVTSNAAEVSPLKPVGIEMKELNVSQKTLLESLIFEYLSTIPKELAEERLSNIKKQNFDKIRFGWAGATKSGLGHYYRVQGESFLIEFDNTLNNANHIHSVWREFNGDFGRDLIKEHYRNSNHQKN